MFAYDVVVITGEELRRARERAGLTQTELADLLGVHKRSIHNWESTQVPALQTRRVEALPQLRMVERTPLADYSDAELFAEAGTRVAGLFDVLARLADRLPNGLLDLTQNLPKGQAGSHTSVTQSEADHTRHIVNPPPLDAG